MTANPLMRPDRNPPQGGPEAIYNHVEKLNNLQWIRNSGKLYHVASRQLVNGRIEHFVDRYI